VTHQRATLQRTQLHYTCIYNAYTVTFNNDTESVNAPAVTGWVALVWVLMGYLIMFSDDVWRCLKLVKV